MACFECRGDDGASVGLHVLWRQHGLARHFLVFQCYFLRNFGASGFCRRLHALPKELSRSLFRVLGKVFIHHDNSQKHVIDWFPVPASAIFALVAASCSKAKSIASFSTTPTL